MNQSLKPKMAEENLDSITRQIIGAAIEVHRRLGPGLLESAYESCLAYELRQTGLEVSEQVALPVLHREVRLDCGYRLDLVVEHAVIVEIKRSNSWLRSTWDSCYLIFGYMGSRFVN